MSKVKRITVSNLKAVDNMTADFNGCTALITGGNNKGKTSFLRSEFDRMKGIKPELILKIGEKEGFSEIELTTGERFLWEFSNKGEKGFKEKMTYITDKDIKSSITTAIRDRYFPATFNVDKFLQDQPAKQRETLQKLVGLDFTLVDKAYKDAYEDRETKNRVANEKRVQLAGMKLPDKVDPVDMALLQAAKRLEKERLDEWITKQQVANSDLRKAWMVQCDQEREEVEVHNDIQEAKALTISKANDALQVLRGCGYQGEEVSQYINKWREEVLPVKTYTAPPEPDYLPERPDETELNRIDQQIMDATETNRKAQDWTNYQDAVKASDDANAAARTAQEAVTKAEADRMNLIKSATMPEGFGFSDDSITYNDLPFTREQLSSSGIYIAALKLAAMTLGEVKTLHFDASFLDRKSLADIEKWANENDLQLLIERPDFEGGEIEYQILSHE